MSSFGQPHDDFIPTAGSVRHFDDDADTGYDSGLPSQQFDSFADDSDFVKVSAGDSPVFKDNPPYTGRDDVFSQPLVLETDSPSTMHATGGGFSEDLNGMGFDGEFGASDDLILPSPSEMLPEEGLALREWRRQNAIRLEEKEKMEKELLSQILDEAEEYKVNFISKRQITSVHNKATNREKEKLFLAGLEKFHVEADKDYWKTISELIPKEVPAIDNKRGKKDKEKPSITVVQGPKPGKPTDLSRMRQILLKLKHDTPPHLKLSPPPAVAEGKDAKSSGSPDVAGPSGPAVVAAPKPVLVA